MAKYDVFPSPDGSGYVLDVQTEWLAGLNTPLVVPLRPPGMAPEPGRGLNLTFKIDGAPHRMVTQFLGAMPEQTPCGRVADFSARSDELARALDLVLHGF